MFCNKLWKFIGIIQNTESQCICSSYNSNNYSVFRFKLGSPVRKRVVYPRRDTDWPPTKRLRFQTKDSACFGNRINSSSKEIQSTHLPLSVVYVVIVITILWSSYDNHMEANTSFVLRTITSTLLLLRLWVKNKHRRSDGNWRSLTELTPAIVPSLCGTQLMARKTFILMVI